MKCSPNDTSDTYDGFAFDLFTAATVSLNWAENANYSMTCMQKDQVITALKTGDNATCFMAIGAITVDSELVDEGVLYSWPFYQGGLRILTTSSSSNGGMWAFFDTFTWQLWCLVVGTSIVVPIVGWIAEGIVWGAERHNDLDPPTYRGIQGLGSMVWHYRCDCLVLLILFEVYISLNMYRENSTGTQIKKVIFSIFLFQYILCVI